LVQIFFQKQKNRLKGRFQYLLLKEEDGTSGRTWTATLSLATNFEKNVSSLVYLYQVFKGLKISFASSLHNFSIVFLTSKVSNIGNSRKRSNVASKRF